MTTNTVGVGRGASHSAWQTFLARLSSVKLDKMPPKPPHMMADFWRGSKFWLGGGDSAEIVKNFEEHCSFQFESFFLPNERVPTHFSLRGQYALQLPARPVSLLLVVCGDTELSALGEQAFLNAPRFWRVTAHGSSVSSSRCRRGLTPCSLNSLLFQAGSMAFSYPFWSAPSVVTPG
jgi:hypothetical protein